ncbi:MAG: ABC transporter permease, partial [Phycisphaerae bacterium]|nr:ABC transporter permease [Phycisphaerae bacterium]
MVTPKLAFAQFKTRRSRTALTLAAIALSVSLIVAVTSGYASIEYAITRFFNMYMGSFDAQVTRQNDQRGSVPGHIVELLNADPRVRRAVGRLETEENLIGSDGKLFTPHPAMIVGIDPAVDVRVQNLKMQAGGKWFSPNGGDVAVIDQVATELLHANVGQQFQMP